MVLYGLHGTFDCNLVAGSPPKIEITGFRDFYNDGDLNQDGDILDATDTAANLYIGLQAPITIADVAGSTYSLTFNIYADTGNAIQLFAGTGSFAIASLNRSALTVVANNVVTDTCYSETGSI